MNTYEYTTGYLLKPEAENVNIVTNLLNSLGEDGWAFTGHAKEVQNGTFYFFARVVSS